jgi:hypothetical protein
VNSSSCANASVIGRAQRVLLAVVLAIAGPSCGMAGANGEDVTPQQLADTVPGTGGIRLISCAVGACDDGFAAQLAQASGRDVLAPTDDLNVFDDGSMSIHNGGSWRLFAGGG